MTGLESRSFLYLVPEILKSQCSTRWSKSGRSSPTDSHVLRSVRRGFEINLESNSLKKIISQKKSKPHTQIYVKYERVCVRVCECVYVWVRTNVCVHVCTCTCVRVLCRTVLQKLRTSCVNYFTLYSLTQILSCIPNLKMTPFEGSAQKSLEQ